MAYYAEHQDAAVMTVDAPTYREEIAKALNVFEHRMQTSRAELDQVHMRADYLKRECEALQQACEALIGIIKRSEEIDADAKSATRPNW